MPSSADVRLAGVGGRPMIDTFVFLRYRFVQSISATGLSGEFMITCPGDLRARCVRRNALPHLWHGDPNGRAHGAVDAPGFPPSVGDNGQWSSDPAYGIPGFGGAQA